MNSIKMVLAAITAAFFVGCSSDPAPVPVTTTINVDCERVAQADGVMVDCGNNGNEHITYYGDTPTDGPNAFTCDTDDSCADLPIQCVGNMHCVIGVCVCTAAECVENSDCEDPVGTCRIPLCTSGHCGETFAPDGEPCLNMFGTCKDGNCVPNQPPP